MNGIELNKINKFIIKSFKDKLKDCLFAIISDGSLTSKDYNDVWSDIDIMVVVEKNDLRVKQKIAQVKEFLQGRFNKLFGINVILKEESQNPLNPTINLDGKTLQALLELKKIPERLLFCKNKKVKFYTPNKKEIKKYSLSNIAMFLLRGRRDLTAKKFKYIEDYKKITERQIRASFIITKLAVQYFTLYICKNKKETLKKAEKVFFDFNFKVLKNNLLAINNWSKIKTKSQLNIILRETDRFIEVFSKYIFNKIKK